MKHITPFSQFIGENSTTEITLRELNEGLKDNLLAGLIIIGSLMGNNYINHGVQRALEAGKPVTVLPQHSLFSETPLARDTYTVEMDPNQVAPIKVDVDSKVITLNTSDISNLQLKSAVKRQIREINPRAANLSIKNMKLRY
jgi:hypothetical protein